MAITPVQYDRKSLEKHEEEHLAGYAIRSSRAKRLKSVPSSSANTFRTEFQRDRDRIIHSRAFRRLKQKTQVFMPDEGDHLRTRLSHTLEVNQLSRTLARSLGLNEDLVEAITLAHDIGHAPFGHSGEEILHKIMSGEDSLDGELDNKTRRTVKWEGFKHNHQSLRIVDMLENKYQEPGLNLTNYVREGVLRHTNINAKTGKKNIRYNDIDYSSLNLEKPLFLEGQVVALVDELAQHTHDMEDGFRAQVIDLKEVTENVSVCKRIISNVKGRKKHLSSYQIRNILIHDLIDFFIRDMREQSYKNIQQIIKSFPKRKFERVWLTKGIIAFSPEGKKLFNEQASFVIRNVIRCQEVDRRDAKAAVIIPQLFKAYLRNPRLLPDYLLENFCKTQKLPHLRSLSSSELDNHTKKLKLNINYLRSICDHIAGMTDVFAIKEFQMMVYPSITG